MCWGVWVRYLTSFCCASERERMTRAMERSRTAICWLEAAAAERAFGRGEFARAILGAVSSGRRSRNALGIPMRREGDQNRAPSARLPRPE